MKPRRETLWTAEANRWNIGKLIVGVLFTMCALRMTLGLIALVGPVNFPNAHPAIAANPLGTALWYGMLAVILAFAFNRLERACQRSA
jgi:hypothetical protein